MARAVTKLFTAGLIVVLLFNVSDAAKHQCGQFFVKQQVVQHHGYIQQQLIQPYVYYQAGRDIELDAIAEKLLKRLELKMQAQQQQVPQQTEQPQQAVEAGVSVMKQHCGSCHSGATPKGGLVYDGVSQLEAWQITAALRSMRDDSMPKDHALEPADKGSIMNELLNLEPPRE